MNKMSASKPGLAVACAVLSLAVSPGVFAAKGGNGGGHNGGGGGGTGDPVYAISLDPHPGAAATQSPLYDPPADCLGSNPDLKGPGVEFSVFFPRHDLCATVTTSDGTTLTDDVHIRVDTDAAGDIVSVRLDGQDVIGSAGIVFISDDIPVVPQTPNLSGDFTVHVDADDVQVWKCDTHTLKPKTTCSVPTGTIAVGDLNYFFEGTR